MVKWLERDMLIGPYVTLVLSEKDFRKAAKHCGLKPSSMPTWVSAKANATVHRLDSAKGTVCIVALDTTSKPKPLEVAGILVHEAVHIWQWYVEDIKESNPSVEFEAYSIQTISQRLIASYLEQTKKPRKK